MMKVTSILATLSIVLLGARSSTAQDAAGSFIRASRRLDSGNFTCDGLDIYTCNYCSNNWLANKYDGAALQDLCLPFTTTVEGEGVGCFDMNGDYTKLDCEAALITYQQQILSGGQDPDRSGLPGACEPDESTLTASNCDFGEDDGGVVGTCVGRVAEVGVSFDWTVTCVAKVASTTKNPTVKLPHFPSLSSHCLSPRSVTETMGVV